MRTRNFLRSCYHGLVERAPAYLLGAIFTAGLAFSLTTYAVHDINVFELDNGTTGANAIDEPTNAGPPSGAADWAQNNFPNTLNNCPDGVNSCGYVSGPNVDEANPGGGAFRSLFIPDPNGALGDSVFAGGGSKDDLDVSKWKWKTGSTSSDKTDLLPVGAAAYLNGDLLIYTFGTLFAPNGNAAIGTWLFKNNIGLCGASKPSGAPFGVGQEVVDPITNVSTFVCDAVQPPNLHENGDVLVQSDNTNGGRDVEMRIYKWVGNYATSDEKQANCSGTVINGTLCLIAEEEDAACSDDLDDDNFCGNMNLDGVPTESPDDWGYLAKGNEQPKVGPASPTGTDGIAFDDFPPTTLFEAGFNFSKLFPNEVGCFNTFLMSTRASQSVDAVLEDFASGAFPLCGISVEKTGPDQSKIGDDATYTYKITNTGAIPLYLDTIVDDVIGNLEIVAAAEIAAAGCATLAPQAFCEFDVEYTVQPGDPDQLINVVEVHYNSASDLSGDDQSDSDDHLVDLFQPGVDVVKTGDAQSKVTDPANYTITVTNTSSPDSPDLVNGSIVDTLLGDLLDPANPFVTASTCSATLATGTSCTISATRIVQAGDPDQLLNTVTVLYNPEDFPNPITDNASHTVDLFQPGVDVVKTGDAQSKVTDPANYTITVTNTGSPDSPDLINGTIVDSLLGDLLDPTNPFVTASTCSDTLATGTSCTISATRIVQAGDPDQLLNTVTVHYNPDGFPNDITDNASHTVDLFQPGVDVVKTGDPQSKVTDPANYTITVTNTSSPDSPDLVNGTIVDSLLGDLLDPANPFVTESNCSATLTTGATPTSCTISATRIVQAGDPDQLVNTVTVHYNPNGFPNDITDNASHTVDLFQPSVTVDKTANCEFDVTVGQTITYSYLIDNTSSADSPDLVNGSIVDDVVGDLLAANPLVTSSTCSGTLAAGADCSITAEFLVDSLPDGGVLTNTVDVLYNPNGFPNEISASDSQSCNIVLPNPAFVVIEKLLRNTDNLPFDYTASGLPVPGFQLIPLFGQFPLGNSPFADPLASESFDDTIAFTVDIASFGDTEEVIVTEDLSTLPAFVTFEDLDCAAADGGTLTGHAENLATATATLTLGSGDFAFCRYINEFNPGDEGCTPGFWKQEHHFGHWLPTGYLPDTVLNTVFTFPATGPVAPFATDTMLEALNYEGGNGKAGAAQILLRAAVAAVLNAAHPDVQFAFTEGQVIALVSDQLQNGNRDSMLALATELDNANNGVLIDNGGTESCPLSGQLFLE